MVTKAAEKLTSRCQNWKCRNKKMPDITSQWAYDAGHGVKASALKPYALRF